MLRPQQCDTNQRRELARVEADVGVPRLDPRVPFLVGCDGDLRFVLDAVAQHVDVADEAPAPVDLQEGLLDAVRGDLVDGAVAGVLLPVGRGRRGRDLKRVPARGSDYTV